jgi:hypothetical protein
MLPLAGTEMMRGLPAHVEQGGAGLQPTALKAIPASTSRFTSRPAEALERPRITAAEHEPRDPKRVEAS